MQQSHTISNYKQAATQDSTMYNRTQRNNSNQT